MKIKLVFDSTIVYTQKEAKQNNIEITPFTIDDNGTVYRDNVDITPKKFYELQKNNKFIKTSLPNVLETTNLFKTLLKDYDHIIYLTLPEKLSGTYAAGKMIAKELDETRISVVDINTGVGMARVLAEVGNKMIEEGRSIEEIIDHLKKAYKFSRLFVIPLNMETLKVGGRVSNLAVSIFSMIKLKICLYLTLSGSVDKFEIARTEAKIMQRVIEKVKKDLGTEDLLIYLIYTDDKSLLNPARKVLENTFPEAEFQEMVFAPTIGAHSGPGTIAFHFCKKHW